MVKLNLGCGNKLYPAKDGWINVDVVTPKEDHFKIDEIPYEGNTIGDLPMFHQSLLQKLQFIEDDCVDEIHGYHIIEHFFRDEVPEVLLEWKRVLKPTGTLVLEQPDVIKCAANFLSGSINGDKTLEYNLGFLGFYGDGTSKEPYMGHKWGWHFQTLGAELHKAGFEHINEQPAQKHMKTIRDFRIIGRKRV